MARKRDVIVGVVIAVSFVAAMGLMMLVFIGLMSGGDDLSLVTGGSGVGVVKIYGAIYESNGREIIDIIDGWADNSSIDALVLHINSPGGGASISQEIYDAVQRARVEKPVVAAVSSVAASGGYMIACGADQIMATPGSITGSIGTIMQFYTADELLDKIGLRLETIKSGELKDVGNLSRDMTEKEELMLRSVIMDSYEQFVEVVAEGREMELDRVRELADGSLFTGHQALNLGLVDTLGGLNEAVWLASDLAGLEGEPNLIWPRERREVTFLDLLGSYLGVDIGAVTRPAEGPQLLYLYQ